VPYRADCYPGSSKITALADGANCQYFAYELIRYYGCIIPDFRSSDLWEDTKHTTKVTTLEPLDLVLMHRNQCAWGAHVGVYVGNNLVVHLSKAIKNPMVEDLQDLLLKPKYSHFIGAKRCLIKN
jgi:lipoprotein Spr